MNPEGYPVFKGLQKPLEFMGIRGRFLTLAAAAIGVSFVGFIVFSIALGKACRIHCHGGDGHSRTSLRYTSNSGAAFTTRREQKVFIFTRIFVVKHNFGNLWHVLRNESLMDSMRSWKRQTAMSCCSPPKASRPRYSRDDQSSTATLYRCRAIPALSGCALQCGSNPWRGLRLQKQDIFSANKPTTMTFRKMPSSWPAATSSTLREENLPRYVLTW